MKSTAANTTIVEESLIHVTNSKLDIYDDPMMVAKKDMVILKKFLAKNKERELVLMKDRRMVFIKN
eukprot:CAMPEP_0176380136 /NCGR_PEP_ID=MMETSP0126-20121128/30887_1 /TAXON_ID=141414 ORGANISM="Strombidinopsis acuminatum, Strain SPMC142" /NCGR_SAMPLE_ID=MMETSP0126 /ASSEMBLY_ACC=CAM_ASM_000229 /LENGTH=65 /DNA_ID=CAMNT_0017743273 /DNA_START=100 /DNA_END=294 /DNA_ORIENTATION=+